MSKFVLTLFGGASNHVAAPGPNVQPNSARNNFYAPDVCFGFDGDSGLWPVGYYVLRIDHASQIISELRKFFFCSR